MVQARKVCTRPSLKTNEAALIRVPLESPRDFNFSSSTSYCGTIINKYQPYYLVWLEVLKFPCCREKCSCLVSAQSSTLLWKDTQASHPQLMLLFPSLTCLGILGIKSTCIHSWILIAGPGFIVPKRKLDMEDKTGWKRHAVSFLKLDS